MSTIPPSTDVDIDLPPDANPPSPPWSHLLQFQFKPGVCFTARKPRKTDPEIKRLLIASASAAVAALCEIVGNRRASPEARCRAAILILERVYGAPSGPMGDKAGNPVEVQLAGVLKEWGA